MIMILNFRLDAEAADLLRLKMFQLAYPPSIGSNLIEQMKLPQLELDRYEGLTEKWRGLRQDMRVGPVSS